MARYPGLTARGPDPQAESFHHSVVLPDAKRIGRVESGRRLCVFFVLWTCGRTGVRYEALVLRGARSLDHELLRFSGRTGEGRESPDSSKSSRHTSRELRREHAQWASSCKLRLAEVKQPRSHGGLKEQSRTNKCEKRLVF